MSIVSTPPLVSTPTRKPITVRCAACHGLFDLPEDSWVFTPHCPSCQHPHAMAEAAKLLNDAISLRDGTGIFKDLAEHERREQLQAIGLTARPAPVPRFDPSGMPQVVRQLASDVLIDIVAHAGDEIARRLGSCDVEPVDRLNDPAYAPESPLRIAIEDQIEDEARELVLAAEAAESPDRFDAF